LVRRSAGYQLGTLPGIIAYPNGVAVLPYGIIIVFNSGATAILDVAEF
jgi:hypothetical protein